MVVFAQYLRLQMNHRDVVQFTICHWTARKPQFTFKGGRYQGEETIGSVGGTGSAGPVLQQYSTIISIYHSIHMPSCPLVYLSIILYSVKISQFVSAQLAQRGSSTYPLSDLFFILEKTDYHEIIIFMARQTEKSTNFRIRTSREKNRNHGFEILVRGISGIKSLEQIDLPIL